MPLRVMKHLPRLAAIGLGLALVAVLSLWLSLRSDRFAERFRSIAEQYIAGTTGELVAGAVEFQPERLRFSLHDVELRLGDDGMLRADQIVLDVAPGSLLTGSPRVSQARLVDATADLPSSILEPGLAGAPSFTLPPIDRLLVDDGRIRLERPELSIDARVHHLDAALDSAGAFLTTLDIALDRGVWRERSVGPARLRGQLRSTAAGLSVSLAGEVRGIEMAVDGERRGDELSGTLVASGDLATVAAWFGSSWLIGGSMEAEAHLAGTVHEPRLSGRLTSPRTTLQPGLELADASADFRLAAAGLSISAATARTLGGSIRLSLRHPFDGVPELRWSGEDLAIESLAQLLPGFPFVAGSLATVGRVETGRDGRPAGVGTIVLSRARPSIQNRANEPHVHMSLGPLDGTVELAVAATGIEVLGADLVGPWYHLDAQGRFDFDGAVDLCMQVSNTDLAAVSRLDLEPGWSPQRLTLSLEGPLLADVLWRGTTGEPRIEVTGRADYLMLHGLIGSDPAQTRLDRVSLTAHYRDRIVAWHLETEDRRLTADGSLDLRGSTTLSQSSICALGWDSTELAQLAASPVEVEGTSDIQLNLRSRDRLWDIELDASGVGAILGRPVTAHQLYLTSGPNQVEIQRLAVWFGEGQATLEATIDAATRAVSGRLRGSQIPVTALAPSGPMEVTGTVAIDGRLSGTTTDWHLTSSVHIDQPRVAGAPFGTATGTLEADPRLIRMELLTDDEQDLWVDVTPVPPFNYRATASLSAVPLEPLMTLLLPSVQLDWSGSAEGAVVFSGALGGARAVSKATLEMTAVELRVGDVELRSLEPWRLALRRDGALQLTDLALGTAGKRLDVAGTIGVAGQPSDIRLIGTTDLGLLRAFYPELLVAGDVTLDAYVRGTPNAIELQGGAFLTQGYIRSTAVPYPLRDVAGEADFRGNAILIPQLTARFGGGQLRAAVQVRIGGPAGASLTVDATGDDVRFTMFEQVEVRAEPRLSYHVDEQGRRLAGELRVDRALYRMPSRTGRDPFSTAEASEVLRGFPETELALRVTAPGNLWLVADGVRLEAAADVELTGTTSAPRVFGSIRYRHQEEFEIEGRRYRVVRASLIFDGSPRLDPSLQFVAESQVQGFEVVLSADGPLSDPHVRVKSRPPLTESEVLALLVGGRVQEELGVAAPSGSQRILYQLLLPNAFNRVLGRSIRVGSGNIRSKTDPSEILPISIRLDPKVDLTIGVPFRESPSALAVLDLQPLPSYTLSVIRDLDRSWAGEALVERRFGGPTSAEPPALRLVAIEVSGAPQSAAQAIDGAVGLHPGDDVTPDRLARASDRVLEVLRKQGYPLARVRHEQLPRPQGATVRFTIEPGESIQVVVTGADIGDGLRRRLLDTVQAYGLYAETEAELERLLREHQAQAGYLRSLVTCQRQGRGPVLIECSVEPGARYQLESIEVVGERFLEAKEFRNVLAGADRPLTTRRLVPSLVDVGLEGIRNRYRRAGYYEIFISAAIEPGRSEHGLRLRVTVTEGSRYGIGSVELLGCDQPLAGELRQALALSPGEPFDQSAVERARERVFQLLDGRGHLDATVLSDTRVDPARKAVDVTLTVDPAEPVRLREIRMSGLGRTRPRVVLDAVDLETGQLISYGRISRAQRRLFDLGVFRWVDIIPAVVDGDRAVRDLEIKVEEAAPYRVQLGGGYDSVDKLRGVFEASNSNLGGRARFLSFLVRGTTRQGRGQLLLREPRLFGHSLPALLTTFAERRQEVSFDADRLAFRAELSRSLDRRERARALLRYSLSATDIKRLQVSPLEAGTEEILLSSLGLTLLRDGRDDPLEPRAGSLGSADLEWASSLLGSEADYLKLQFKGYHYMSLSPRLVWAASAQLGLGYPLDDNQRLPLLERFFAGGASTLRGFGFHEAGPLDPESGVPTGGNAYLVFNQELRFDLLGPLVSSVFVDTGNVYRDTDELGTDLRWSVGAGLRYRSAIVAGIDYARLVDRRPEESADQLHFSLGFAF